MPFPITKTMTATEFRSEIIDYYFGDKLKNGIKATASLGVKDPETLIQDYASIGSFLTDKAAVEKALEPLETLIRNSPTLTKADLPRDYGTATPFITPAKNQGSAAPLKSHKLITEGLRKFEAETGFNHEKLANGTFHDEAKQAMGRIHSTGATSDTKGKLTSIPKELDKDGKEVGKEINLPRGAPTIYGDLDPAAFNVLLRHGYQFKDVAAGAYHGEYTHRLQWYAIAHRTEKLNNPMLVVFRSMGFLFAKADKHVTEDAMLWMWQALFDTAESQEDSKRLRTVAYTTNGAIFTCPENMNRSLMTLLSTDTFASSKLWCLRVLLKTRWKKRFDETSAQKNTGLDKLLKDQMPTNKTRAVVSSDSKSATWKENVAESYMEDKTELNPKTGLMETKQVKRTKVVEKEFKAKMDTPDIPTAGYALAWYLRNDTLGI
jgi:hypothetical protein